MHSADQSLPCNNSYTQIINLLQVPTPWCSYSFGDRGWPFSRRGVLVLWRPQEIIRMHQT